MTPMFKYYTMEIWIVYIKILRLAHRKWLPLFLDRGPRSYIDWPTYVYSPRRFTSYIFNTCIQRPSKLRLHISIECIKLVTELTEPTPYPSTRPLIILSCITLSHAASHKLTPRTLNHHYKPKLMRLSAKHPKTNEFQLLQIFPHWRARSNGFFFPSLLINFGMVALHTRNAILANQER